VNVLSIVHGEDVRTELFGPVAAAAEHRLDEWSFGAATGPARPLDSYDAVLVFGGSVHPDQEGRHVWLRDEIEWLQGLISRRVPTLGICLGSQLVARAAGSWVGPLEEPEIGWHEVELTEAGATDPVLSALPPRFQALQWHHYEHGQPDGAVALARNSACLQGFRIGEACWGVQFHPEVTEPQLARWLAEEAERLPDAERLETETREKIGHWNELGRRLCRAFLATAEQLVPRAG
jgi:GMP synthase (glutamine-hydrolysing)